VGHQNLEIEKFFKNFEHGWARSFSRKHLVIDPPRGVTKSLEKISAEIFDSAPLGTAARLWRRHKPSTAAALIAFGGTGVSTPVLTPEDSDFIEIISSFN